ncbi:CaiB/BaiF CoA transferase family protein [Neoaquamicrobium sediminum]|uniref:CaiB/BaiF CoA transferase family protein n=1 Tax=Neoaquamicrobium sediminum TaxID=1849104 RepID=UPI0036104A4E
MTSKDGRANSAPGGPLAGLRVLDLTQFLSGPYCTLILGDLGAEIVKVEPPQGDSSRHVPPHFVGDDSAYFLSINRNKKSIVLDLKSEEGRDLLRRLALVSDIVVENFRPGVLERLGVSPDALRQEKPSLVWCAISGFGQSGPYRDKPAYDMIVQALSGGMSMTGEKGRGAVRAGIPLGDLSAGMYAAIGILAAINRRHQTGQGEMIDISMLDCQAAMLSYQAAYHLHSGHVPDRQGSGHDSIPTYRTFTAQDGIEVVITANTERMWQGLCRALGVTHLIEDPRFLTNRERYKNRLELWPLLEAAFLAAPADDWVAKLEREEVPVGVVNTLDRVVNDPQILHREMVLALERDGVGAKVMGNPVKLAEAMRAEHHYPPALGADGDNILRDILNLGEDELADLRSKGVNTPKPA